MPTPNDQPDPLNPNRKLYTYEGAANPTEIPVTGAESCKAITAHVEEHIGPTNGVFHEILSDQVHLDLIIVPPNEKFPEYTIVTSGMSDRIMRTPKGNQTGYAELLIRLPATWQIPGPGSDIWKQDKWFWPLKTLKFIARFPHVYNTLLGVGHTLDNHSPAEPWSPATEFNAAFLAPSRTLPEAFEFLELSAEKKVQFIALYPAYTEETTLARSKGASALWSLFVEHNITDVLNPTRPSVVPRAPVAAKTSFWNRLLGR